MLLLGGIDVEVLRARALADDHSLVDLVSGCHDQRSPVLELEQGARRDGAAPVGDQRPGGPGSQLAMPRLPAVEHVVNETGAPGLGEELRAEPDESARGYQVLHPD